jgi:hypothetical protein
MLLVSEELIRERLRTSLTDFGSIVDLRLVYRVRWMARK